MVNKEVYDAAQGPRIQNGLFSDHSNRKGTGTATEGTHVAPDGLHERFSRIPDRRDILQESSIPNRRKKVECVVIERKQLTGASATV